MTVHTRKAACLALALAAAFLAALPRGAFSDSGGGDFVGSVIFSKGAQVVAEIPGGAVERERMTVVGGDLRPKAFAAVVQPLADGTFVLRVIGSGSAAVGDRLARETEPEAAARVLRENRVDGYREFLDLYPKSPYRERIGREMFRLAMSEAFPSPEGSVFRGKVRLIENLGRELPLRGATVTLDRFVLPPTDADGGVRLEGIPVLEEPVTVRLRLRDPRFEMASEVEVALPAGTSAQVTADVPVRVVPAVLAGKVVDGRGAPLPGAEVWTSPYTTEVLSGDDGTYRIFRRKLLAPTEGAAADEPLFGGDFEVYARRKGHAVERVWVSAESHRENPVPLLQLPAQDPRQEDLPDLALDLRRHLWVSTPLR
ncbi:MAG: hypothetical protein AB1578_02525 [Thermodesulfobacteriota bacterium]